MFCKNIRGMGAKRNKSWKEMERESRKEREAERRKGKGFMRELLFTEAEHRQKGRDKRLSATLRTTR